MSLNECTVKQMENYLKAAYEFEKYVYIWNSTMQSVNNNLRNLYSQRESVNQQIAESERNISVNGIYYKNQLKSNQKKAKKLKKILIAVPLIFIALILMMIISGIEPTMVVAIVFMFFAAFGLIFGISIIITLIKYKNTKDATNEEKINASIRRQGIIENDKKSKAENELVNISIKESEIAQVQKKVQKALSEARTDLTKLYNMNLIPAEYRNLVAVGTMHEYLYTGRCDKIKGHGGIYDTFVKDKQQEAIISNLKEINQKQDIIIQNQRIMISEIRQANSHLVEIKQHLSAIEKDVHRIAVEM